MENFIQSPEVCCVGSAETTCDACPIGTSSQSGDSLCVQNDPSPSPSPSPTPSPTPTPTLSSVISSSPTPTPTQTPSQTPTQSPSPSPSTSSPVSSTPISSASSDPSPMDVTASPSRTPTQTLVSSISSSPVASASERQRLPVAQASTSAQPGSSALSAALLFRGFPSDAFVSESAVELLESSITSAVHDGVQGAEFATVFVSEIIDKNDSFTIYSRSAASGRRLSSTRSLSQTSSIPTEEGVVVHFVILLPPSTSSPDANAQVILRLSSATQASTGSSLFASAVISKMQSEAATSSDADLALFASSTGVSASNAATATPTTTTPNAGPFDKIGGVSGLAGIVCAAAFMIGIVIALVVVFSKKEKVIKTQDMNNLSLRAPAICNADITHDMKHSQNDPVSLSEISVEPKDDTSIPEKAQ